jgi:hypothetical protein
VLVIVEGEEENNHALKLHLRDLPRVCVLVVDFEGMEDALHSVGIHYFVRVLLHDRPPSWRLSWAFSQTATAGSGDEGLCGTRRLLSLDETSVCTHGAARSCDEPGDDEVDGQLGVRPATHLQPNILGTLSGQRESRVLQKEPQGVETDPNLLQEIQGIVGGRLRGKCR